MTDRSIDPTTNTPLNPPEPEGADKVRELMGERHPDDQGGIIDYSELDTLEAATPTELYEGEPGASLENDGQASGDDIDSLEMLTERELRAGETDDVQEAIEEGYTYIPPIDPPVVPEPEGDRGDYDNADVANGFAVSSLEEPYNQDTHSEFLPADDEVQARVRDALRLDSSTSALVSRIGISVRNGIVTLRGVVDDLVDSDNLLAVAEYVEGVEEVIDELEVRGM